MKLYTEKEIKFAMLSAYLTGVSRPPSFEEVIKPIFNSLTPIELPSDDEMANASNHCEDGQVKVGFLRGVLWYQEQIKKGT